MSSGVGEEGKDVEVAVKKEPPIGSSSMSEKWPVAFKLLELVFEIFCIGLIVDPINKAKLPNNNMNHVALIYTTYNGFTIITTLLLLARGLFGEQIGWRTSAFLSFIGASLHLATAIVVIADWSYYMNMLIFHPSKQYMDMMLSSGVFSLFNTIVYTLDAFFTVRQQRDFW